MESELWVKEVVFGTSVRDDYKFKDGTLVPLIMPGLWLNENDLVHLLMDKENALKLASGIIDHFVKLDQLKLLHG